MRKHAGSGVEALTDESVEDLTIDGMLKSQYMAGDARYRRLYRIATQ